MQHEYLHQTEVDIPNRDCYRWAKVSGELRPWLIPGEMLSLYNLIKARTLMFPESLYTLHKFALQCLNLEGEFWECGVYAGGSSEMLALTIANHRPINQPRLRMFDTFEGMPETEAGLDFHRQGDFSGGFWASIQDRFTRFSFATQHRGFIPATFAGLEGSRIALLHCDLDIYKSIWDNLEFCYPRMVSGGVIVFDDYGHPSCPGARKAIDEFFATRTEDPIALSSGQAFIVKI